MKHSATAILEHHIKRPHILLLDVDTKYETMLTAFPKVSEELETHDQSFLLSSKQVFNFVQETFFKEFSYKDYLLGIMYNYSNHYRDKVERLIIDNIVS